MLLKLILIKLVGTYLLIVFENKILKSIIVPKWGHNSEKRKL
jgi:hypothetical protein